MERSSIVQQLLSDPRDPFNRAPCTEEDLVPETELKSRWGRLLGCLADSAAACLAGGAPALPGRRPLNAAAPPPPPPACCRIEAWVAEQRAQRTQQMDAD